MLNVPEVWGRIAENETVRKGGSCKGVISKAHGLPKAGTKQPHLGVQLRGGLSWGCQDPVLPSPLSEHAWSASGSALTVPGAAESVLVQGMNGWVAWEEVQSLELGRFLLLWEDVTELSTWADLGKTKFPVQQGMC